MQIKSQALQRITDPTIIQRLFPSNSEEDPKPDSPLCAATPDGQVEAQVYTEWECWVGEDPENAFATTDHDSDYLAGRDAELCTGIYVHDHSTGRKWDLRHPDAWRLYSQDPNEPPPELDDEVRALFAQLMRRFGLSEVPSIDNATPEYCYRDIDCWVLLDRGPAIALTPDGKRLAFAWVDTGNRMSTVDIWDLASETILDTVDLGDDMVTSLVFSPSGRYLLIRSASSDVGSGVTAAYYATTGYTRDLNSYLPSLTVYDLIASEEVNLPFSGVADFQVLPGDEVIAANYTHAAHVRLSSRTLISRFVVNASATVNDWGYVGSSVAPGGRHIATCAYRSIHLWDVKTHKELGSASAPANIDIRTLHFTNDGTFLGAKCEDGQVLVWKVNADPSIENLLTAMSPQEFEDFVARIFRRLGWQVAQTSYSRDGGYDLEIARGDHRRLVECKRYGPSSTLGRPDIQKFHSAVVHSRAHGGYVVFTGRISGDAAEYARAVGIDLVDRAKLEDMIWMAYPEGIR